MRTDLTVEDTLHQQMRPETHMQHTEMLLSNELFFLKDNECYNQQSLSLKNSHFFLFICFDVVSCCLGMKI